MDNVLEFWSDPIASLKKAANSDKVIAGYFDSEGYFRVYVGSDLSYMEKLLAVDTFSEVIKRKADA